MPADSHQPGSWLSVREAVALMVGIVIGIGIFRTPPLVAANVDSEVAFIGVWVLGGLVTLVGALCYAELAATYPHAGGEYHFLRRAYGHTVSLFFAWARCSVIQTGAIATVAFVYGDYAQELLPLGPFGPALHAALVVLLLTGLNMLGTFHSKRSQLAFTGLTLLALFVVVVAGLVAEGTAAPAPAAEAGGPGFSGAVGLAMVFVLLTYGGWNEAAYLSGELRQVQRNMIRVLVGGTVVITVAYVCVNLAYLEELGLAGLRETDAPAAALLRRVAGEGGAVLLGLVVCCMAISTINATIFTGGRTYIALGRDLPRLEVLARRTETGRTPANGLMVQGLITLLLIVLGAVARDGFKVMVEYTAPVFWLFMLLVGVALLVLRRREPAAVRPFRVPLYPVLPLLFVGTCAWLLYSSIVYTGFGALVGIAVLLAGTPLLLLRRREQEVRTA